PEAWAQDQQGETGEAQPETDVPATEVDVDAPLEAMPDLSVEWPDTLDLPPLEPLTPDPDVQLAQDDDTVEPLLADARVERLGGGLELAFPQAEESFPMRSEFVSRFAQLSTLHQLGSAGDNIAVLAARARRDEALLGTMLRIYGYYDAQVIRSVGAIEPGETLADGEASVRFDIVPGPRYRFGAIDLGDLMQAPDATALRGAFEIQPGDPLSSDKIVEEQYDLDEALGENGYVFAKIGRPSLLVDHDREEGDLTLPVTHGGKYVIAGVNSSLPDFLSSRHLQTIARFHPGDVYRRSLEFDLRRAIVATGLVSSVTITPREVAAPTADQPGSVMMDIELVKAPLRTISGAIGYGSEEGFRVEGAWEHRNLFPDEGSLRVHAILGTQEQLGGVTVRKNNFRGRDQILTLETYVGNTTTDSVEARTVTLRGTFERRSNLLFQKPFSWQVGTELLYSDERNRVIGGIPRPRETYLIADVFGRATIDTTDSLLDPTSGFRLTGFLAPEVSRNGGAESFYLRNQADASYYRSVGGRAVLAGRVRFASIQGAPLADIAPSRRLYAGGGSSVRGYGYQAVGPRNDFGEPTGGLSLVEASVEARINTGWFDGALQIVPFADAGSVSLGATPDLQYVSYGVGVGIRYKTGFGPIRVDVGVPLNRNPMFDSPVAVYVSLGQAF
ncbi:MAG: BamA/TamA family outer membrane protein, partial [Rhodobacteraceae bacterium]|nr:BamA/TamA family outer membrane protein [Paracoccaceae bacterium]